MADEYEFTIEGPDGATDTLTVPAVAFDLFANDDDPPAAVVGNLAMLSISEQLHSLVHHVEDDPDQQLHEAEQAAMEAFEERFGASFGAVTGHDH